MVSQDKRGLGSTAILAVGYGLFMTWFYATGFSSALPLPSSAEGTYSSGGLIFLSVVSVTMLFVTIAPRWFASFRPQLRIVMPLLASVGMGTVVLAHNQTLGSPLLVADVGFAMMGIGYAVCQLLWIEAFGGIAENRRMGLCVAVGYALIGPILILTMMTPWPEFPTLIVGLLLLASAIALQFAKDVPSRPKKDARPQVKKALILQLLTFGIGMLVLRALQPGGLWGSARSLLVSVLGHNILAIAIGVAAFGLVVFAGVTLHAVKRIDTRYVIAILMVVAAFMVLSLLRSQGQDRTGVYAAAAWATEMFCGTLLVVILVDSARELRFFPTSVYGVVFSLQYGLSVIWRLSFADASALSTTILLAVAYLFVVAAALVPRALFMGKTRGSDVTDISETSALCSGIAREYGLSLREEEILCLLAEGRSIPNVQSELVIAEGTAKTHVAHIYSKLGVHTRQELLGLVFGFSCVEASNVPTPRQY